ncbi:MAG: tandem-95 repeat protein [Pirellulaceae bacterium]
MPIPQSSTPSIAPIGNVTVGIGSPLNIPIDGYDPNGNPLTITVTSSNPGLIGAQVLTGNRSWKLSVQNFGDMVFELFENEAPRPAERVIALTQSGFYNGAPFHRVVNNFVIQGGDPVNKDGTGGSPLGKFDDQYNLDLQHNRKGVLSYAKSTDDTGDSQFFITAGATRYLDFNHSIFGQLIEGEVVRDAISKTPVNNTTQNKPINPVIITSASVFTDTENGVVMLKPTGTGTGTATITVTAKDSEGNSTSQTFTATVVQDTANGAPFLNDIPTVQAQAGVPMTINLSAQDAENDTLIYSVTKMGSVDYTVTVNSSTGVVTLTPPTGFSGQLQFMATVKQTTTPDTSSPDDNQVVTVNVTQSAPTTIDLLAESDSGASSTDNNTNAQTLTFAVGGTTAGAVVEVLAGGNVVGTATATATTTNVTVNNVASLGQGSVLFTSRQRISGVNSSPSPALAVVLDSQAPAAIASGVLPANTLVEQPLSVDLNHADEGHGLVYALVGAPAGMTIDSNTGVLSWTPSTAQLGVASLTLKLTDAAGNLRDQPISINVMEQPKVRISLKAVDMTGAPITTVATGQQFKVQVIVKDLRTGTAIPNSPTGVYSAYLDMLYDPTIIEPIASNPLRFVDPYLNDAAGSTSTPGLIDELGAFSDRSSRQGPDAAVLVEVTFVAKAAGNPNLRSEAPDLATSEVGLYDMAAKIPLSQVEFLGSPFVVGADFIVANDVYNFDEDTGTHVLNVLTNDTTQSGSVLTIASVSAPTGGGTVTIASDGKTLNYTSVANFHGAETFTYTARNQQNVPLTATVTVQVTDVNDPPVALNDTFTVFRNTTQNILEVLINDTTGADDPNAESLTVTAVSAGSAGGTIELGPSGLTVRYTPKANFSGTETFTYTLSDGRGGTATGNVSVAVNLENPPPTPQNDTFQLQEDAAENLYDVLANDTTNDPSETLSISAVGTSTVGSSVSVSADGLKVRYRPAPNFNGSEVLTYTLRDSGGATAVGQMTFTVAAVNDPPDAINDNVTGLSSTTTQWNVLANDVNVDQGETLKITAVTQPPSGQGTVAISSDGSYLVYTGPGSSFEGSFSITYTINDGTGLTDTATIAATISNYVPRAISGVIVNGDASTRVPFVGVPILLSGTDLTGAAISKSTTVGADGSYNFAQLAPGDYQLSREPLAFINDAGATVNIQSGVSDGDMVSNLNISGSLKVGYFDIRDFLGSTNKNSLTVAVEADGTAAWIAPRGDWAQLTTLQANLDTTANALKISAANGTQSNLKASVPLANNLLASVVGRDASMQLLRIRGSTVQAGLAATSTPASISATSSTNGTSGTQGLSSTGELDGEGEGEGAAVIAPAIETSPSNSPLPLGELVAPTPTAINQVPAAAPQSPSQAIQRLLGSSPRMTASDVANRVDTSLTAAAVDEAMQSVLPSMQLQLADDLSDTLARRR